MPESFGARLMHAWNVFTGRDIASTKIDLGYSSSRRPDRPHLTRGNERSIMSAVYNRIAMDCSLVKINHVKLDDNGRYIETIDSGLNNCLTLSANKDQTGRDFIQDTVLSMFDEGVVCLVPVDTNFNPRITGAYDILSIRVARILQWYPDYVRIDIYNDNSGKHEQVTVPKSTVCIIQNPFYAIMNEPNSTVQRLIRKLNLLDVIDEQSSAGKMDLIIQLPYIVKSTARKEQAEARRKSIEEQLAGSKYGIAYTDGTEKITQLNRPIENNLMSQIEYLVNMVYSQLGITKEIMEGTANEEQMLNYNNRTLEPILSSITDEIKRKFLTKTARTQKQSIMFFREPFKLVPVNKLADTADKFTRNEIMSSNEFRQVIGMKPSNDPKADELRNKNITPNATDATSAQKQVEPQENVDQSRPMEEQYE